MYHRIGFHRVFFGQEIQFQWIVLLNPVCAGSGQAVPNLFCKQTDDTPQQKELNIPFFQWCDKKRIGKFYLFCPNCMVALF
jgi:hypothetical protein